MGLYEPVASVEQVFTKIRSLVKKKYGDGREYSSSLKYIVFDKTTKQRHISNYNARIEEDMKNSEIINISTINKLFIENAECLTYTQMLTYLLLNSGSRHHEIYNGHFEKDGEYIQLSNISKTKNKMRKIKKRLLDNDVDNFLRVLTEFRKKLTSADILPLNIYLRKKYNITSYKLRKWYANVSYVLDCPYRTQKQQYIAYVLGHDNVDSSKIYGSFVLNYDEPVNFR